MKRSLIIGLLLALAAGTAFPEEVKEAAADGRLTYFGVGAGLMYKQPTDGGFEISNFRIGVTGDLLFSLGMLELGVEIGAYAIAGQVQNHPETIVILEIPLDALVRINFTADRRFAVEARGGAWFILSGYIGYPEPVTEFGFNAGARLVLHWFYIGAGYAGTVIFYPAWLVETGVKFSF